MSTPFAGTAALTEFWAKVKAHVTSAIASKQDTLVSGTNIKTINNQSLLGSGNLVIGGGGSNPAVDYIVDCSYASSGGYRKWSSGKMEQWVTQTYTGTINTSWGSMYRTSGIAGIAWPTAFDTIQHCFQGLEGNAGDMAWVAPQKVATTTNAPDFYLMRGAALTSSKAFKVHHYAIGTWGAGETLNIAYETEY